MEPSESFTLSWSLRLLVENVLAIKFLEVANVAFRNFHGSNSFHRASVTRIFCEGACRHGIKQMLSNWADGPTHITQCPLSCGESYTYEFTVANQSGTYFWHAHAHWLRATVYGAFVVHSKATLPYSKPTAEKSILFGK